MQKAGSCEVDGMVKAAYLLTSHMPMLEKGDRESHAGAPVPF